MDLAAAVQALRDNGADRVLLKRLSHNDSSQGQVYLRTSEVALRDLRVDWETAEVIAREGQEPRLWMRPTTRWMDDTGQTIPAPHAKVIFYPQYPEARLSGFAKGVPPGFGGRNVLRDRGHGRTMLLGLTPEGGWLVWVGRPSDAEVNGLRTRELPGNPFVEVLPPRATDPAVIWSDLLAEVTQLVAGPPLPPVKLKPDGTKEKTKLSDPHSSGWALEAALGIPANSAPGPDYRGLVELKTFSGYRISLMTPEPTAGVYVDRSKAEFMNRWGKPAKSWTPALGPPKKLYFNGQHRLNEVKDTNPLTLRIHGWTEQFPDRWDATGHLALRDDVTGDVGALWPLVKMNAKWMEKHPEALYVQYKRVPSGFQLTGAVIACHGTDFRLFMMGLRTGTVIFDPGTSMPTKTQSVHSRSQWRTYKNLLLALYDEVEHHDLSVP